MSQWKLSCYTSIIDCDSGESILYNSFMGGIARVAAGQSIALKRFFRRGIAETELGDPTLKRLCDDGFFVRRDVAERKLVSQILDKERNSTFSVIIRPHEDCNFRCTYCYDKFKNVKIISEAVAGLKALIERKSKDYRRITVSWFGGEPLLARDEVYELSDSFMHCCARTGAEYSSSMTTNGYLLVPETVGALLSRQITHFQVSLDGPKATHDRMRKLADGKGTYQTILNNLTLMRNRNEDFTVRVRVNFDKASALLLDRWLSDELGPLLASDPRFIIRFHALGNGRGLNDATPDACDQGLDSGIRPDLFEKSLACGFSEETARQFLKPHGNVCYAARESSVVVGCDGAIYKCAVAFDDSRNHLGRLTKEGRLIIDRRLWDRWVAVDDEVLGHCVSCALYPVCQSRRCPLGAMDRGKPVCPLTITEYESLVKLVALGPTRTLVVRAE
ncbi:MAG: radical SAM protein [Chloroflexi bacterium]|nr:radical SAM protein [Chloroflexota bacterium]